jgi:hypothetical protein
VELVVDAPVAADQTDAAMLEARVRQLRGELA